MKRYIRGGVYAEVKPVAGYFYFPELIGYPEKPVYFWSFGIGGSIGFMKVTSKKHLVTNFSIGGQYLPIKDPRTYFDSSNDNGWWYGLGPGSVIELKLTFGNMF